MRFGAPRGCAAFVKIAKDLLFVAVFRRSELRARTNLFKGQKSNIKTAEAELTGTGLLLSPSATFCATNRAKLDPGLSEAAESFGAAYGIRRHPPPATAIIPSSRR